MRWASTWMALVVAIQEAMAAATVADQRCSEALGGRIDATGPAAQHRSCALFLRRLVYRVILGTLLSPSISGPCVCARAPDCHARLPPKNKVRSAQVVALRAPSCPAPQQV